jgi:uncharacterized membrane protein
MIENTPTEKIMEHIRYLCKEIGARGSTTAGEAAGSAYCLAEMKKQKLDPKLESFESAKSIFLPHLLASLGMLVAFVIYPLGGAWTKWIGLLVSLLALISELLELSFKDNIFRHLVPKGNSQNVVATIAPAQDHNRDLVLIGHVDSQRTPLIFRNKGWVEAYKTFTTITFILFSLQVLFFLLGAISGGNWTWYAAFPSAICAVILAIICLEADRTPFTVGANDNASAVGMVLTLAELFSKKPLRHTRLWLVCTGCEEVQHYGAIDFFKRHRPEMVNPKGLVFEMLGCAGPGYLLKEGIVVPFRSDPELVKLVEELAAKNPQWEAYPVSISGGNSELSDCVQFRVPAITLFGLTRQGDAPYWHQVGDTLDKINPSIIQNTFEMTISLIHALDT